MLAVTIGKGVRLIVLLCLFVGCCCCHSIRHQNIESPDEKTVTPGQKTIQVCGWQLTETITSICEGNFLSPNIDNTKNTKSFEDYKNGVVEKCCLKSCDFKFLIQYCRSTKSTNNQETSHSNAFNTNNELPHNQNKNIPHDRNRNISKEAQTGKRRTKDTRHIPVDKNITGKVRMKEREPKSLRNKGNPGTRGRQKKQKKKRNSKRDCVHKSFGHYSLNFGNNNKIHNKIRKREDMSLPPIQVGSISPKNFGGAPVVVAPKFRSMNRPRTI